MDRVESDLNKSKQLREKQFKEFSRQMDEQAYKHDREVRLAGHLTGHLAGRLAGRFCQITEIQRN